MTGVEHDRRAEAAVRGTDSAIAAGDETGAAQVRYRPGDLTLRCARRVVGAEYVSLPAAKENLAANESSG